MAKTPRSARPSTAAPVSAGSASPPRLSVVVPVFEEEEIVPELLRRTLAVLDSIPGGPHELVVVDDGSGDRTLELLAAAAASEPRLTVVALSRNFGHQTALTAGLDHATGDVVAMMDGDLQDPPELLPAFLERYHAGYEVVVARRATRQESLALRLAYWLFYRLIAVFSDVRLPLDSGDFSLLSRRAVDAVRSFRERHRYLRGYRAWIGLRQCAVDVARDERAGGTAKYTVRRLIRLALDGLFAFTRVPLRIASLFGLTAIAGSSLYAGYAVWQKLAFGNSPQGFTALLVALVFFSGVQLVFLGVVGEYVGRIYEEVKARPLYLVERVIRRDG